MTPDQLAHFCPAAAPFNDALQLAFERFQIDTPKRQAVFLAQCAHESAGFTRLEENLNYSADALARVWPKHFDHETALKYAHQPQKIANHTYAGRNGNGDEASGDGWRYRGRGLIQLTGLANYGACSTSVYNDDRLVHAPDDLTNAGPACLSAAWFWDSHRLNDWADVGTEEAFITVTRKINGGTEGLGSRMNWWDSSKSILGA